MLDGVRRGSARAEGGKRSPPTGAPERGIRDADAAAGTVPRSAAGMRQRDAPPEATTTDPPRDVSRKDRSGIPAAPSRKRGVRKRRFFRFLRADRRTSVPPVNTPESVDSPSVFRCPHNAGRRASDRRSPPADDPAQKCSLPTPLTSSPPRAAFFVSKQKRIPGGCRETVPPVVSRLPAVPPRFRRSLRRRRFPRHPPKKFPQRRRSPFRRRSLRRRDPPPSGAAADRGVR